MIQVANIIGKLNGTREVTQSERVVLQLTSPLIFGHNITCDNFFTSFEFATAILANQLTMVGTVRENKLTDLKNGKPESTLFAFSPRPNVTLTSYDLSPR